MKIPLKITLIITLAILLLCFTSCTKDGTLLKGRVLEYGTETPLEDIQIQIIGGKAGKSFGSVIEWVVGTATSDKNGRFSICVDDADYYRVDKFIHPNYFEDMGGTIFKDGHLVSQNDALAPSGVQSNPVFYLDPKGTLHVVVENDPNVVGDFIVAEFPSRSSSVKTTSDFEEYILVRANRYNLFGFTIDQKHDERVIDSIYCIAFDTTELKIIF